MAENARELQKEQAPDTQTDDVERGVVADSETAPNDRTLSAVSSSLATGVAGDSVPPKVLGELSPGDRIHLNDDLTTYSVQYPYGGILSGVVSEVHVTRDRDGKVFTLLTTTVEREEGLTTAVKLADPSEIRAGSVESAEDITVVKEVIRIGRGNPAKGLGRDVGLLVPSDAVQEDASWSGSAR